MSRRLVIHSVLMLMLCLLVGVASVQTVAAEKSTFEQILDRGEIVVGLGLQAPPYGYRNEKHQPVGYDVEVANLIAQELGVKLKIVEVTGPNRIPYLLTKKVDLVIATFGITPERAKSISFTNPYYAASLLIVGSKDADFKGVNGMSGFKVGVPRGTTQDITLTAVAPKGTEIIRYEDDVTTTTALLTRRVDALIHSDLLAHEIIQKNPTKKLEIKGVLRVSPAGIGVREEDGRLLQWLNTFIFCNMTSGKLQELYQATTGTEMTELPMKSF